MPKCPFLAIQRITREVTRDESGKVISEKETPATELQECLRTDCELYDAMAAKCSLPTIDTKISRLGESGAGSGDLGAEIKETRESMVASLLHVLKKADTHSDLLQQLNEAVKGLAANTGTGAPAPEMIAGWERLAAKLDSLIEQGKTGGQQADLAKPLAEIKEALNNSQTKFGDILELILEDHQQRAAEKEGEAKARQASLEKLAEIKEAISGWQPSLREAVAELKSAQPQIDIEPAKTLEALAGISKIMAEVKENLGHSQTKFGDILELMLEDHQKRAADGSRTIELLQSLNEKQEAVAAAVSQGLKDAIESLASKLSQDSALSSSVGRLESVFKEYAEAEARRQAQLETVEAKMAEVQQGILNLLEAQRNEQRAASNERRRREAEEHNERGVMYFHRRELAAAEREFNAALEIKPDFAEAYNNLGLALSDQGRKEEAVKAFRKAIELSPEMIEAYNNLGCLYKIKKDYQQAVELFNQAIAKKEDYSLSYFNLGLAYEEMEKFEAAIKCWEKVLALQPTHEEARRKLATYRARRV